MDRRAVINYIIAKHDGCRVIFDAGVPEVTEADVIDNRILCEKNLCRNYDTSCTCPPRCGSPKFCSDRVLSFKGADVVMCTYEVDVNDGEKIREISDSFRGICRDIMIACRNGGIDMMALVGGPCRYCKRCAALDNKECYHPDKQVPSVSGYGVKLDRYLAGIGESFSFEKDKVTLYGLLLFR